MRTINQEQRKRLREAVIKRMVEVDSVHRGLADLMIDRSGDLNKFKSAIIEHVDEKISNIIDIVGQFDGKIFDVQDELNQTIKAKNEILRENIINSIIDYLEPKIPTENIILDIVLANLPKVQNGKTPTKKEIKAIVEEVLPGHFKLYERVIMDRIKSLVQPKVEELNNLKGSILEKLQKDKEIKFKATDIEGLEQTVKAWINQTGRGRGGYIHGAGITELTAGTGIALARDSNGNYTITATGSASLSILAATGDKDDSNKDFVFASKPSIIFMNGTAYRDGSTVGGVTAWTWNAGTLTATMFAPVGTGGDIYGI